MRTVNSIEQVLETIFFFWEEANGEINPDLDLKTSVIKIGETFRVKFDWVILNNKSMLQNALESEKDPSYQKEDKRDDDYFDIGDHTRIGKIVEYVQIILNRIDK